MKIHLHQIPEDGLHVEGTEEGDILEIDDPFIRPVTPVRYELDIGLSEGGLFATGTLEAGLEMQCVRCLRTFERTLQLDSFALQTELTGEEMIDLTPFVREDILLALPAHPHCDWDGATECPGLAPVQSPANLPENDSAFPAPQAWDALDQIKISSGSK